MSLMEREYMSRAKPAEKKKTLPKLVILPRPRKSATPWTLRIIYSLVWILLIMVALHFRH